MKKINLNRALAVCGLWIVAGLIAGCSTPDVDVATGDVEAPPSIQRATETGPVIVNLDASEVAALNVETHRLQAMPGQHRVIAPGETTPFPENFVVVSAPISGRVVRITAHEGERVRRGQVVAELESIEYADLVASYLQATAEKELADAQLKRTEQLYGEKIAAQSVVDRHRAELTAATAGWEASKARLLAVGISEDRISTWDEAPAGHAVLPVYAPISGYIEFHGIDLGQAVDAYDRMLTIISPEVVLVKGYVSPSDGDKVRVGDAVAISHRGEEQQRVLGEIISINPALNEANKAIVVNVQAAPVARWPRPGELVTLTIQSSTELEQLLMPMAALQYEGNRAAVFVRISDTEFEKRYVELGSIEGDEVEILGGVVSGEEVAITQVFNLKAISRFEQYGEE